MTTTTARFADRRFRLNTVDCRWLRRVASMLLLTASLLVSPGCGSEATDSDDSQPQQLAVDGGSRGIDGQGGTDEPDAGGFAATGDDCPGGPGCACVENAECDNDTCIDTPKGRACAQSCVDSCPTGFRCTATKDGDVGYYCLPKFLNLCAPCQTDLDCDAPGLEGEICVSYGDAGNFCGTACKADDDCPTGYGCQDANGVEGSAAKQCVKLTAGGTDLGLCDCSDRAVKLGRTTTCFVENAADDGPVRCKGVRHCAASGLSACAAPPAAKEVCDGLDQDCDGKIDEGACDDGNGCTHDVCDPKAAADLRCQNKPTADACVLADGNPCFVDNVCKDGTCAKGKVRDCNDNNTCTDDSCDPKSVKAGSNGTGCVHKALTGPACDDGNACTTKDRCDAGKCAHKGPLCADGNPCTQDHCAKDGSCKHAPIAGTCDDGNSCTVGDACVNGACLAKKTVCTCNVDADCSGQEDGDLCNGTLVCDKSSFPYACKVNPKTVVTCKDDKGPCGAKVCDKKTGGCAFDPATNNKPCDADGNACTTADSCHNGACKVGKKANCDDGSSCTADSCKAAKGCVHAPTNSACDDGNACTYNDACDVQSAACKGTAKVCNDGKSCTKDTCDAKTGACTFKAIVGCDGYCTTNAQCDDNNSCTLQTCVANKCIYENRVGSCTDPVGCARNAMCKAGKCVADTTTRQTTVLGTGKASTVDAKKAVDATIHAPNGMDIHPATGDIWVTDSKMNTIRKIPANGIQPLTMAGTIKGHAGFADGKHGKARYSNPRDISWSKAGFFYVADTGNRRIRRIKPDGMTTTAAGSLKFSMPTASGNQADATKIGVGEVVHVGADNDGGAVFSSKGTHDVWQLSAFGSVKRLAGTKTSGFKDGPVKSAKFGTVTGLDVDCKGRVVVADGPNGRIRRIDGVAGIVTTIAGQLKKGMVAGPTMSGGEKMARLQYPGHVRIDASGTIWFVEAIGWNSQLRRITADGQHVENIAGKKTTAVNESGAQSVIYAARGLAVNRFGEVFVSDRDAHKVLKVWVSAGACGIGQACFRASMPNPDNTCQVCSAAKPTTWSAKPNGCVGCAK